MKVSATKPIIDVSTGTVQDKSVQQAFRILARILDLIRQDLADGINSNELTPITQAGQPTPAEGQFYLWLNSSGTPGQSKAIIVARQGGASYTFKSAEVY